MKARKTIVGGVKENVSVLVIGRKNIRVGAKEVGGGLGKKRGIMISSSCTHAFYLHMHQLPHINVLTNKLRTPLRRKYHTLMKTNNYTLVHILSLSNCLAPTHTLSL